MKHRYISLLAVPLLFCSAKMREPAPVRIIYPAPRHEVVEVEECDKVVEIPEIKAAEPVVSGQAPEQVERYPGVNLNALPENAQQIAVRLLNRGVSHEAISGILANVYRETGGSYSPTITNGIGAVGICQWLGVRAQKLYQRDDWDTIRGQVDFLLEELATTESSVDLSGSAYDCGYKFARDFERTCVPLTYADRGHIAEEIFSEVFG